MNTPNLRYADDTLFGFTGPKAEAEEIKQRLTAFLRDELHLELSAEVTGQVPGFPCVIMQRLVSRAGSR
jgi:hypothetical protein